MAADPKTWSIGLLGYGEVGRILAEDLCAQGMTVRAHDLRQRDDGAMLTHADTHGVALADSHAALAAASDLVISAVTAGQTVAVAQAAAPGMRAGAVFLDLNSASPGAKLRAALAIEAAGACYLEGAVMTSVPPYRLRVPLLVGGPHAARLAPALRELGFSARPVADKVDQLGVASATKMCRSIMIKGLEALVIESFTAARAYGVEDAVLASLHETFPSIDWEQQGAYFFQRVIEHGRRRAEEVFEVAQTVREAGLDPLGATAIAQRQAWVAQLADAGTFGQRGTPGFARSADWRTEADRLLATIKEQQP
ncbi:NAD(P)-dependent oxidoreductase [Rugamonas apoptosis]|uniref:DUF1932 domain-containing protein n=1 Tax=Rugamonas apoptosis TaxID=2758570 RepID=A0A7W2F8G7_9BURK|nr:NAD(P)-dependent oxidoreductase [Rugamonas apoptosis]MBA5687067.1 DUF1932 domain-containing protein [Rugamonas apoptosis]